MIKEYMKSKAELVFLYPVGSIHEIDGKKWQVAQVLDELPSTAFYSLPRVEFIEVVD